MSALEAALVQSNDGLNGCDIATSTITQTASDRAFGSQHLKALKASFQSHLECFGQNSFDSNACGLRGLFGASALSPDSKKIPFVRRTYDDLSACKSGSQSIFEASEDCVEGLLRPH